MTGKLRYGLGWLPDLPDLDLNAASPEVREYDEATRAPHTKAIVDLSAACSPIEFQQIQDCTAHAAMSILEFYWHRKYGTFLNGSRRFLYKVTRTMMGVTGDTGAYLRTTMGAMRLYGVPPEDLWPYDPARYEDEPTQMVYAAAQNFQALGYYRVDKPGMTPDQKLRSIQERLTAGHPMMFGFAGFPSIQEVGADGWIPFPREGEEPIGGHAISVFGYDDARGCLRIRNSWGPQWGNGGYGLLPYDYVLRGLTDDWWVMSHAEWVDLRPFEE